MHWFWRATIAAILAAAAMLLFNRIFYPAERLTPVDLLFPVVLAFAILWGNRQTRCRKCGHILRGISEPRCPECGEKI